MLNIKQENKKRWKLSDETKKRMSIAQKGRIVSVEARKKISLSRVGKKLSNKTREKMKISAGHEETHQNWKGNNVGYFGIHKWVEKWKGKPRYCEICGTITATKYEWANIDHKYRRVLDDFIRVCVKCHRNYDKNRGIKIC